MQYPVVFIRAESNSPITALTRSLCGATPMSTLIANGSTRVQTREQSEAAS